jgi:hypothetical protein
VAEQINKDLEQLKYEIPESCHLKLSKGLKVEKYDGKYLLVAHPHAFYEGEMLLVQPKKSDQSDKDTILLRDYSLRKRIPTHRAVQKPKEMLKEQKKKDEEFSKLQCTEIDIAEPLCHQEWVTIAEVLNGLEGLFWFQVLPVGEKSSLTLQFNTLHFLPQSRYPYALPIETFLKLQESNDRKIERRAIDPTLDDEFDEFQHEARQN